MGEQMNMDSMIHGEPMLHIGNKVKIKRWNGKSKVYDITEIAEINYINEVSEYMYQCSNGSYVCDHDIGWRAERSNDENI